MFDIGWIEMTVIVIIAIIVIGPRELPKVARAVGKWVRRARAVAREFQDSLDEVMREADLEDTGKRIGRARVDPGREIERAVDPEGEVRRALDDDGDEPAAGGSAPREGPDSDESRGRR